MIREMSIKFDLDPCCDFRETSRILKNSQGMILSAGGYAQVNDEMR